jgi:hypothetical protein
MKFIASFFAAFFAALFGCHFRPHARTRGTLAILGGSGYQRGVELEEIGINCESVEVRYFPEVNEGLQGIGGEIFLKAKSAQFSRDVTVAGEVGGATGVMAFGLIGVCSIANDVATFGDDTGSLLLDEATETQNRTAWRHVSLKLSSNPNLDASA